MSEDYSIDREMMADFIDESLDSLAGLPQFFLDLEANPMDLDIINSVFRPIHSLKGNAAYFGLMKIKGLAHDMESVLDLLRKARLAPTQEIIDALLAGVDQIISILDHTRTEGSESVEEEIYESIRNKVQHILAEPAQPVIIERVKPDDDEGKWEEILFELEALRMHQSFHGTDEGKSIEHVIELVRELSPYVIEAPEEEQIASNPINDLELLIKSPSSDLSNLEKVERTNDILKQLSELAKDDAAKEVVRATVEDFNLLSDKVDFMDAILVSTLEECINTLRPMQSWSGDEIANESAPPPKFETPSNPLENLRLWVSSPPEGSTDKEITAQVAQSLHQIQSLASADTLDAVNIAIEEFDLFMSQIGWDQLLKESLIELADKIKGLQSWEIEVEPVVIAEAPKEPEPTPEPVVEAPPVKKEESAPLPPKPKAEPEPVEVEKSKAPPKKKVSKEPARTMRVSEDSIDAFLGFVGELIAVDEMFRYIHSEMVRQSVDLQISAAFLRVVNTFTKLSDDLQLSIMEIRRVSVKAMLQKAQRIIRDIAKNHQKRINADVAGEEIRIDRSLIDTLEAPLVHMVRNAADHGIELSEERKAQGKSLAGNIQIHVKEAEEDITLTIADDGRGLNYKRIREKAVNLGMIKEDDQVSNAMLAEFIFSSGFSTADKVTDVSGRGVGMDAVKRSVEDAGGRVELESTPGEGSVFRIVLPKTVGTQILNSFVVLINGERFVLPMDRISGSFKPNTKDLHCLPNGTVCIARNDCIMPIICLEGPYTGEPDDLGEGILIAIESKLKPFAFYVDTILGMQKVVLRSVPWIRAEKFVGAAVMGDGRVSMIVNIGALEALAINGTVNLVPTY